MILDSTVNRRNSGWGDKCKNIDIGNCKSECIDEKSTDREEFNNQFETSILGCQDQEALADRWTMSSEVRECATLAANGECSVRS